MDIGGGGGGVVAHDGSAGSHAAEASAASPAGGVADNYRQIGKRKGNGRLLLGAAHSYHASSVAAAAAAAAAQGGGPSHAAGAAAASLALGSVPSIPSRFETVLYAGDQEPDAFNSRVARFKSAPVDLPGPGSYAGDVVAASAALRTASTSWSTKGLGVGFVSKEQRFKRRGGGPGPGAYAVHAIDTLGARTSSAPNRGSSMGSGTAAFKSACSATLDPTLAGAVKNNNPGPGYYEPTPTKSGGVGSGGSGGGSAAAVAVAQLRKRASTLSSSASASALAAQFQAASLASPPAAFNSRDTRFRPAPAAALPAPGVYDPRYGSIGQTVQDAAKAPHANFRSTTDRTDFTYKSTNVPGPGAYTKPVTEEKSGEGFSVGAAAAEGASGTPLSRVFKSTGQDRFGRPLERKTLAENLPGPGSYDPYIPGTRSDSPIRGGPSLPPGAAGTGRRAAANAGMVSPTSPLAASQSHGVPLRSAAAAGSTPESRLAGGGGSPSAAAASTTARRKKRAAGVGGPGRSLLATRGGPGVALNSPALLLHPQSVGTFGRAGAQPLFDSPSSSSAASSSPVVKDSEIRPPGPAWYNAATAFHSVQDKKAFHLNTAHRWM